MEKPADQMLRSTCQFLASSNEEKLAFLPAIDNQISYMYNECGDRTHNPLVYYCSAAYELMSRHRGLDQDEFSGLMVDISAMLSVMFDLGRTGYPWIWELDKRGRLVGEVDRCWTVLQRLAVLALTARGWPRTRPEIPFRETGWSGFRQLDFGGPEAAAK
jgi:hypothetical protein